MTSFFLYCIKKMSFSGSPKGTPHDWCRRTMKKITQNPKNVQSAGFHTCFRYGNIIIPMVFALALFMHSKILPQIFLPQIF